MKRHPALVGLSRQHHDGLALGVFIERGLREGGDPSEAERLRAEALEAWELELRGHFEVEESILFPVVREALADPGVVDQLIREHGEIRGEMAALEQASGAQVRERLLALRERLVRHIRTEERILFEAVQDALDEPALLELGQRIDEALPSVCVRLGSAAA